MNKNHIIGILALTIGGLLLFSMFGGQGMANKAADAVMMGTPEAMAKHPQFMPGVAIPANAAPATQPMGGYEQPAREVSEYRCRHNTTITVHGVTFEYNECTNHVGRVAR